MTRGRKKGRKKSLNKHGKFWKSNFFQRKILRISTIFSNFKQNKQFSKKNSENFQGFYWNFSNFHSIFKRNFWFCKIHLKIERNWEKKKLQKFIVRLTGEWKKAILENFGWFLEFFGKLTWFFDNFPFYNNSQNSIIHFLKFRKNLDKKFREKNSDTKFRFLKFLT